MKKYLYKKEYVYLYLSRFSFGFANTIIDVFGTVMLYKSGIPIYFILLIYGIRFGIMGAFTPLYIKIASKCGVAFCRLISNLLRIISCYMLITGDYNMFLFIIAMGIPGGLSNPIENAISARYIEEENRGKYNSIRQIFNILGVSLGTAVITTGILTKNNIYPLILVITAYSLQVYFAKKLDYKPEDKNKETYKNIIKDLVKIKSSAREISIIKAFDVIEKFFVPLYIYIALNDFVAFSLVITFSLIVQSIILFITGSYIDKDASKTNNIISSMKAVVSLIFIIVKNKIYISLNNSIYSTIQKMYETSYNTELQETIKESEYDNDKLATLSEMWLCYTELIVLMILSIISFFIQERVFYFIFISQVIAAFYASKIISKNFKKRTDKVVKK